MVVIAVAITMRVILKVANCSIQFTVQLTLSLFVNFIVQITSDDYSSFAFISFMEALVNSNSSITTFIEIGTHVSCSSATSSMRMDEMTDDGSPTGTTTAWTFTTSWMRTTPCYYSHYFHTNCNSTEINSTEIDSSNIHSTINLPD